MIDWKTELSETCDKLKEIRHKFGNKRDKYTTIIQKIIRTKYNLYIPKKYYKKKHHPVFKMIGLLIQRAFLLGYRQALEDVGELEHCENNTMEDVKTN